MTQFSDSIKKLFRPSGTETPQAAAPSAEGALRRSNGLREFCRELHGQEGLRILDLGTASQANVNFFTELGHKIYTEDLHQAVGGTTYRTRGEDGQWRFDAEKFLGDNLNYQMLLFDAVLCWDVFDQLDEAGLRPLVDRLHYILKPGGVLLAFFHLGDPGTVVPVYRYRIQNQENLELMPRGQCTLRRPLNNRNIENLFKAFHSLKFFLSRDNLREVLVIR